MIQLRKDIAKEDQWNLDSLFKSSGEWEEQFEQEFSSLQKEQWEPITRFQNSLGNGPKNVKTALLSLLKMRRNIEKFFTFAHLKHDEDITNDREKAAYQKILGVLHNFFEATAWFEPELLSLPQNTIENLLKSSELEEYLFYLERIFRLKNHTLSTEGERVIALSGRALQALGNTFSAINDADFTFGSVQSAKGEEKEITHATYSLYIRDFDRTLRERAFKQYHSKYKDHENTLCELLQGQVQSHLFQSRARNYSTCLEAALFPNNIDKAVYHSLIEAVNQNLDALHHYVDVRKKVLGLQELHLYDMYVPLTKELDIKVSYKEAEDLIIDSLAPLGSDYQNILRAGLKDQRWVDRYENKNKRSGAYSSGCYDSHPYILMNYKGLLRDVFTLAHEAGHSMHSYYSRKYQPYIYADYPIFLAEVASTFNEDLLTHFLLEKMTNPEEKLFLINQKIEDIRTTLFRQTLFAEFELLIHKFIEEGIPLTPKFLKDEYCKLNAKYFGQGVIIDEEIAIEWARIPHFYYNFYVYQYATGISASLALSDRVMKGDEKARDDYLTFLKSGSSQFPLDLLKSAGVDMTTPKPVNLAIDKFRKLVKELENLCENLALSG